MSEYVITTDNNSDLPEKYLKDHGVGCMYLSYSMDGKNYTHGNFLPEHEFYEAMRNGSMPTTAQVNPENAKALLEPYLKEGKDILHIAFSSALSGTYNSSRIAAEELMEEYPDRKMTARITPMMMDVTVNSGVILSAGIYGLNSLFSFMISSPFCIDL